METKINIAEILRNKPHGVKLYSPIFGDCTYCYVREDTNDICVKKHNGVIEYFNSEGLYFALGEVMLFPSKSMRDWSKFSWKKGDALSCGVDNLCIFEKWANKEYTEFYAKFVTPNYSGNTFKTEKWSKETNEAVIKQYISNIEEFKGGKLNRTTLEIEKTQPEFKDGDIVVAEDNYYDRIIFIAAIKDDIVSKALINVRYEDYKVNYNEYRFGHNRNLRLATDSEKKQLFSAIEKEGKRWDSNKKSIVDLKPKVELKPFDKVLVRDGKDEIWEPAFFFRNLSQFSGYNYQTVGGEWRVYCIPYIGNESLLGTTKDVEG